LAFRRTANNWKNARALSPERKTALSSFFYHYARLVEMIGYVTGSMRQFNQRSV
jgi:hypothetical protein